MPLRGYARPATQEEAWQLNQKKPNRVLGGMLWLKMEKIYVGTAIDLSALGLDTIEETDTEIIIGAMATLRDLETNVALNAYTAGAEREAVRHIVGVQFRNCATAAASSAGSLLTMSLRGYWRWTARSSCTGRPGCRWRSLPRCPMTAIF